MTGHSLVLQSPPHPLERLPGYLLRLAHLNGFENPTEIFPVRDKIRINDLALPTDFSAMARILAIPTSDVQLLSYAPTSESRVFVFGQQVQARRVQWAHPKVCPMCLQEFEIASSLWDISLLRSCYIHSICLVDRCSVCCRSLSPLRPGPAICECGADLRSERTRWAALPVQNITAQIVRACGLSSHAIQSGLDTAALSLDDLLYLVEFVGMRSKEKFSDGSFGATKLRSDFDGIVQTAGTVFDDPVPAIREILLRTSELQCDSRLSILARKYFRGRHRHSRPNVGQILENLSQGVSSTLDMRFSSREMTDLGYDLATSAHWTSRSQLLLIPRVGERTFDLIAEESGIEFGIDSTGRTRLAKSDKRFSTPDEIRSYIQDFRSDMISAKEVAEILHLKDRFSVGELATRGLIKKLAVGGLAMYSSKSVDDLFNRLLSATHVPPYYPNLVVPDTASLFDAIEFALAGQWPIVDLGDGPGLARFGVIDRLGIVRMIGWETGGVLSKQVADFLGCVRDTVLNLAAAGYLARQRSLSVETYKSRFIAPRPLKSLSRKSVEDFSNTYLLSRPIAAALGCGHRTLGPKLKLLGISRVATVPGSKGVISIWPRDAIEVALGMPIKCKTWID